MKPPPPPTDAELAELNRYQSALAAIVVDLAFLDPLRQELQGQSGYGWECLFCRPDEWPPGDRSEFVHTDSCPWQRSVTLTRPEMSL